MCLYPTLIRNRKYLPNKKNGGVVPPFTDERVLHVPIGCQKCMECRKQKARNWQVRLLEDIKHNKNGKFVTLTFSNDSIRELKKLIPDKLQGYDIDNAIATLAVRRFLERWRKEHKKSLRHWLVTELGHKGTEHLHLHGIVWTDESMNKVENHWGYGHVWKGNIKNGRIENYVNARTVNYMVKYVNKADEKHKEYNSIILTSSGIGRDYTNSYNARANKFNGKKTEEAYRTDMGHKIAMPIYWRNKIYNDKEREELWLNRLDKEERFVNGERVSIANGDKEYYKLLEWHRNINKRLGYGDNSKTWKQKEYEQQRRNLKIQERVNAAEK